MKERYEEQQESQVVRRQCGVTWPPGMTRGESWSGGSRGQFARDPANGSRNSPMVQGVADTHLLLQIYRSLEFRFRER